MKKDVIYIDTEDDITSIIGKVKDAAAPIVALVPPKRVGVLQSVVNLKLLNRAAESSKKRIVLITNDSALVALASGLSIPIAKNLQSKPEVAEIAVLDSDDGDVIDGEDLPVGELEKTIPSKSPADDDTGPSEAVLAAAASGIDAEKTKTKGVKNTGSKIPNFDTFRKKLFIFGGLGVFLIAFLIWAIFFAGQATIAITARTNSVNISKTLQLRSDTPLDANQGVLPVVSRQSKKTVSVDFTATGKKDVGEKAAGTARLSKLTQEPYKVPAGTQVAHQESGLVFVTAAAVTIPSSQPCFPSFCAQSVNVGIVATESGTKYNGASGAASSAGVTATISGATTGGTDKTITIVSAEDIEKAKTQLQSQDANAVRGDLAKQFTQDDIVITEAYVVESGAPTSTPAVGQEATTAKLSAETTYTLLGVKRADLKAVYDVYLQAQLKGDTSQKVYRSGDEATQFSVFQKVEGGFSVKAIADAQVGPNIDSQKVAKDSTDKQVGEVKQSLQSIQGVENVEVDLSPFWVTRVPGDANKIKVTFVLKND